MRSENETYLLDAAAVVKLLLDGEDDRAFGQTVLKLAFFEGANTLYRITAHEQRLARDEADLLVEQLSDLRNEIDVLALQDAGGIGCVYQTAWATSLTVYGASYVVAAEATERTLVTTNSGIHDHAPADVDVRGVDVLQ